MGMKFYSHAIFSLALMACESILPAHKLFPHSTLTRARSII